VEQPRPGREGDAIQTRHRDIGDNHRYVGMLAQHLQAFDTVGRPVDVVAHVLEYFGHSSSTTMPIGWEETICFVVLAAI
jgi:hypothetical protein